MEVSMNAAEQIVEQYLRLCLNCFTMTDCKVKGGNNRQFDILAISPKLSAQYHVEVSVTHQMSWCPDLDNDNLTKYFDRKFLGIPPQREGSRTDSTRVRTYRMSIDNTYSAVGLDPKTIKRVFCCWAIKNSEKLSFYLAEYKDKSGMEIEIWSLRDKVLPSLLKAVSTANYDDHILRTLSLLQQYENQKLASGSDY